MHKIFRLLAALLLIAGCSDPKSTVIPSDLSKMDTLKPTMEKITEEERTLVTAYIFRHTMGSAITAAFGGKATPIPEGMTIGKAIEEQRQFAEKQKAQELAEQQLKEKLKAEREKAMSAMRDAVTVTLTEKKLVNEYGYSGIITDEKLNVRIGYKNNTDKEIAGVKGRLTIHDLFGDEISAFQVSNDNTISAHGTITWTGSRSVKYSFGSNNDRKFASLPDDKYKQVWEPQSIVFKDGSKLTTPE